MPKPLERHGSPEILGAMAKLYGQSEKTDSRGTVIETRLDGALVIDELPLGNGLVLLKTDDGKIWYSRRVGHAYPVRWKTEGQQNE